MGTPNSSHVINAFEKHDRKVILLTQREGEALLLALDTLDITMSRDLTRARNVLSRQLGWIHRELAAAERDARR